MYLRVKMCAETGNSNANPIGVGSRLNDNGDNSGVCLCVSIFVNHSFGMRGFGGTDCIL